MAMVQHAIPGTCATGKHSMPMYTAVILNLALQAFSNCKSFTFGFVINDCNNCEAVDLDKILPCGDILSG